MSIADELLALFRRFISAGEAELTILPLWALHTHAFFGISSFTPYLAITSPEKGSGKTRLLEVLHGVVREPLITASISPAALARTVDESHPTLLLDELDALLRGDKGEAKPGEPKPDDIAAAVRARAVEDAVRDARKRMGIDDYSATTEFGALLHEW